MDVILLLFYYISSFRYCIFRFDFSTLPFLGCSFHIISWFQKIFRFILLLNFSSHYLKEIGMNICISILNHNYYLFLPPVWFLINLKFYITKMLCKEIIMFVDYLTIVYVTIQKLLLYLS